MRNHSITLRIIVVPPPWALGCHAMPSGSSTGANLLTGLATYILQSRMTAAIILVDRVTAQNYSYIFGLLQPRLFCGSRFPQPARCRQCTIYVMQIVKCAWTQTASS